MTRSQWERPASVNRQAHIKGLRGRSFAYADLFPVVPELTAAAHIKINTRVSLQPIKRRLALLQVAQTYPPHRPCASQGPLQSALEAAPPHLKSLLCSAMDIASILFLVFIAGIGAAALWSGQVR